MNFVCFDMVVVVLFIAIVFLILAIYRISIYRDEVLILGERCNYYRQESEHLHTILVGKEKEIEAIKQRLECLNESLRKQKAYSNSIMTGAHIYNDISYNRNISQKGTYEIYSFISFYCEIDCDFSNWLIQRNLPLTYRDKLFCILIRLGKKKNEILEILRYTDGSYRTVKCRIKNKLEVQVDGLSVEECIKLLN